MSALAELKQKTAITLKEIFNDVRLTDDGEGFEIPFDDFFIRIVFTEDTDEESIKWCNENGFPLTSIRKTAIAVDRIKPSSEFYEYLAVELPNSVNSQVYVGRQPNSEEYVYCSFWNRIAGDSADPNEIKFSVITLMWDAQNGGKNLIEKFGAKWIWSKE